MRRVVSGVVLNIVVLDDDDDDDTDNKNPELI